MPLSRAENDNDADPVSGKRAHLTIPQSCPTTPRVFKLIQLPENGASSHSAVAVLARWLFAGRPFIRARPHVINLVGEHAEGTQLGRQLHRRAGYQW